MKELFTAYCSTLCHLFDLLKMGAGYKLRGEKIPQELLDRIKTIDQETNRLRDLCFSSRLTLIPKK